MIVAWSLFHEKEVHVFKSKSRSRRPLIKGLLLVLGMTFVFSSCGLFSSKKLLATIIANNICGATVDVYLNGVMQTSVSNNSNGVIEELDNGTYALEAIKTGGSLVVFSSTLEIDAAREYIWVIEGQATFQISNQTGETITLAIDNVDRGQIPDQISQTVSQVPFGDHALEAKDLTSGSVIASTTIDVENIQVYHWIVTK